MALMVYFLQLQKNSGYIFDNFVNISMKFSILTLKR